MRLLSLSKCTLPSTRANRVQSRPVPTFLPARNFVPRWRTRMLPAVTNSPPNRLTPSLLLTLSRPLRTLPPPFLCAIKSRSLKVESGERRSDQAFDFLDFHDREFLAVPRRFVIAFAPLHLKGNGFRAAFVLHHINEHAGLRHGGRADGH